MKQYPSIDGSKKAPLGKQCIAFTKYDGSNLRFEWSSAKGWHKFGTRTQLYDATDPVYGPAIPIFMDTMADEIVRRMKDEYRGIQRITAFTEFFGPKSFVGQHDENDEMELRLIDMYLFKKGFMDAREFVKLLGDLPYAAEMIYRGTLNSQFIADVRAGKYPVWEGVVAKGVVAKGEFGMVKIKTDAYFKKLNEVYGTAYRNYWE